MFPGDKGGRCAGLTTLPIVLKSESLNLLEPSGPVKACNGIALPLPTIQEVEIRSAHILDVTLRKYVDIYRRFG
jgi:hypothetical protein